MRTVLCILFALAAAPPAGAAVIQEDFSGNPAANGWLAFGETNLFQWDNTNQSLRVTWDSSQTNSFFHHPLQSIVSKDDDFSLTFDLRLDDILAGANPDKPSTFQIAIALLNLRDATRTNNFRASGVNANTGTRNSIEFDYFPDSSSGFGATVSPTLISSNNQFASSFTYPLELTTGEWFHVALSYTASNRTLTTILISNGQPVGPVKKTVLGTTFTDFRVDSVAVCSYSDAGQSPPEFAGSVLAHGVVDNFAVVVPLPIQGFSGGLTNTIWQGQFTSRSNWLYTLERTADFQSWTNVSQAASGNATNLFLQDTNPPTDKAFYRVQAQRP
jgi:hypothetical protein